MKLSTIMIQSSLSLSTIFSGCAQKHIGCPHVCCLAEERISEDDAYRTIDKDLDALYAEIKIFERVLGKPLDRGIYDTLKRTKQAVRNKDEEETIKLYWQTIELARDHLVDSSTIEALKLALKDIGKRLDGDGACKEALDDLLALRTRNKLREIVIPEFTIGPPATLIDAFDFFKAASRDYDDPKIPVEQRGVGLVLNLAKNDTGARSENRNDAPFAKTTYCNAPVVPYISVRFISLYDAIHLVCEATSCKFDMSAGFVLIKPSDDNVKEKK